VGAAVGVYAIHKVLVQTLCTMEDVVFQQLTAVIGLPDGACKSYIGNEYYNRVQYAHTIIHFRFPKLTAVGPLVGVVVGPSVGALVGLLVKSSRLTASIPSTL
jgi:hypothetical protein